MLRFRLALDLLRVRIELDVLRFGFVRDVLRPHIVPDASGQLATGGHPTETGPAPTRARFHVCGRYRLTRCRAAERPHGATWCARATVRQPRRAGTLIPVTTRDADAGEGPWGPRGGWARGHSMFIVGPAHPGEKLLSQGGARCLDGVRVLEAFGGPRGEDRARRL
jgi:hypothetical protein